MPNSGKPSVVSTVIDIGDGTTRDGLELARACVAEWERMLTQAGLSIVRRSEQDGGASGRHLTRIFTAAGTGQIASALVPEHGGVDETCGAGERSAVGAVVTAIEGHRSRTGRAPRRLKAGLVAHDTYNDRDQPDDTERPECSKDGGEHGLLIRTP